MPSSVSADSASRAMLSFRPTSRATRTRSWPPIYCLSNPTTMTTSLQLPVVAAVDSSEHCITHELDRVRMVCSREQTRVEPCMHKDA
jgi:hypothetical protein